MVPVPSGDEYGSEGQRPVNKNFRQSLLKSVMLRANRWPRYPCIEVQRRIVGRNEQSIKKNLHESQACRVASGENCAPVAEGEEGPAIGRGHILIFDDGFVV